MGKARKSIYLGSTNLVEKWTVVTLMLAFQNKFNWQQQLNVKGSHLHNIKILFASF